MNKGQTTSRDRLIIFGRYPVPGRTKTRLIPALGPAGAADLQRRLTETILETVRRFAKTWGEGKFAELMLSLKKKYDLIPVLVGGKDNLEYNRTIIRKVKENGRGKDMDIVNATGTGLRELCSMLKDASLFVGIDSGIMHLASSLDIPVVGIFGPTDPFYVGPQNDRSIVVREEEMKCVPCYLKTCDHRDCMRKLTVDKVLHACEQLL